MQVDGWGNARSYGFALDAAWRRSFCHGRGGKVGHLAFDQRLGVLSWDMQ